MVELVRGSKVAPSILSQDLNVSGQIVSSGDVQIEAFWKVICARTLSRLVKKPA